MKRKFHEQDKIWPTTTTELLDFEKQRRYKVRLVEQVKSTINLFHLKLAREMNELYRATLIRGNIAAWIGEPIWRVSASISERYPSVYAAHSASAQTWERERGGGSSSRKVLIIGWDITLKSLISWATILSNRAASAVPYCCLFLANERIVRRCAYCLWGR